MEEFYTSSVELLTDPLLQTFNDILTTGILSQFWKQTTATVVPMEQQSPLFSGGYHPITLLNMDLKLFTSMLTACLNVLIVHYIWTDQVGFLPG